MSAFIIEIIVKFFALHIASGIIVTFITLNIAAMFFGFEKDQKAFALAAFTYGILYFIRIPIPIIGAFFPAIGMYIVLVGTDYESHNRVLKLCIANWFINILILYFVITKLIAGA